MLLEDVNLRLHKEPGVKLRTQKWGPISWKYRSQCQLEGSFNWFELRTSCFEVYLLIFWILGGNHMSEIVTNRNLRMRILAIQLHKI